jgi:hypothetical protein
MKNAVYCPGGKIINLDNRLLLISFIRSIKLILEKECNGKEFYLQIP